MSEIKVNSIVDASGGNTATINGVAPNVNNIRGKNKIINGNFDVWQRGTGAFTSGYTTDRFWIDFTDASPSVSQSSFTLGQADVPNEPKHYLTYTTTTASTTTERALIQQGVEGVRSLAGQTATLSFWAKADAAKDMAVDFRQYFGGGGGGSADAFITPQTVSLTTSWQKFEVTVAVPSISGKTLGSSGDDQLLVRFWFSCGSAVSNAPTSLGTQSGTFDIAQVQLEVGDTASGFETLSYGETLAMCQRYYWRLQGNGSSGQALGAGYLGSAITYRGMINLPVYMRNPPTVSYTTLSFIIRHVTAELANRSATSTFDIGLDRFNIAVDTTGLTAGQGALLYLESTSSSYIEADAEL